MKLSEMEAALERQMARQATHRPIPPATIIATPDGGSVKVGEFSPFRQKDAISTILSLGHACNLSLKGNRHDSHLGAVEV